MSCPLAHYHFLLEIQDLVEVEKRVVSVARFLKCLWVYLWISGSLPQGQRNEAQPRSSTCEQATSVVRTTLAITWASPYIELSFLLWTGAGPEGSDPQAVRDNHQARSRRLRQVVCDPTTLSRASFRLVFLLAHETVLS